MRLTSRIHTSAPFIGFLAYPDRTRIVTTLRMPDITDRLGMRRRNLKL
jgi:hypothetical protein